MTLHFAIIRMIFSLVLTFTSIIQTNLKLTSKAFYREPAICLVIFFGKIEIKNNIHLKLSDYSPTWSLENYLDILLLSLFIVAVAYFVISNIIYVHTRIQTYLGWFRLFKISLCIFFVYEFWPITGKSHYCMQIIDLHN